ncbi:BAPKO_0422 family outer member beta-barrel protein [Borrelia turicatae]|uniref:Uncharacterized protein n=2 Tax=Borrelia turicatae TaxID=142 RepID=A0A172XBF7_BORTU|nr:DUF3996 domain-containing protein [Borrelia turicatae]AAX17887.1 hypothetical protein BT0562A [Borrelia turicatae 91E135]ANF34024.1 hypothetical protein A7978_02810 [Borrelia turicatae]UPA13396.1 DUF3996 domain-containing protein [Borrelia turicatae 91E135]UPA14881.1 DUF3996 domain-containing protein [Borrelia turicatae]
MKKIILILLLINYFNVSAKESHTNKGYFGIGILGPLSNAFQLVLGKNITIEIGIYNGLKNLFNNFNTLFASLEFTALSSDSSEQSKAIDASLGIGIYGLWWIPEWQNTRKTYNSTNIGIRISLTLNLPIIKKNFDIFLKTGPGINIWGIGGGNPKQKWEAFAGLGMRLWFA